MERGETTKLIIIMKTVIMTVVTRRWTLMLLMTIKIRKNKKDLLRK